MSGGKSAYPDENATPLPQLSARTREVSSSSLSNRRALSSVHRGIEARQVVRGGSGVCIVQPVIGYTPCSIAGSAVEQLSSRSVNNRKLRIAHRELLDDDLVYIRAVYTGRTRRSGVSLDIEASYDRDDGECHERRRHPGVLGCRIYYFVRE